MNAVPLIYRILLILLLPCIAVVLYLRGQHYDPALINFKSAAEISTPGQTVTGPAQTVAPPSAAVPEAKDIAGFHQVGREQRYTKDNLYEHVDGHAEYFIGAGFAGLSVTEYASSGQKSEQAEIQVEVFDMGNSIQAFGVLSDESGENAQPVPVGAMGFKTSGGINFIKGKYYVKVSSFAPNTPVIKFAKGFNSTLPASRDSFEIFSMLPDIGKVEKTRFIKEGYRGLDFLRNVVEREYSAGGKKVTVALMAGNKQDAKTLQSSFFDYFKKSGMRYEKSDLNGQEFYKVTDKYEGNWFLIPSADAVFGVFGTEDEAVVKYFGKGKG